MGISERWGASRDAEPVLRFAIISEGRVIYRAGDEAQNAFELAATREYRDTRPHREIQDAHLGQRARSRNGLT